MIEFNLWLDKWRLLNERFNFFIPNKLLGLSDKVFHFFVFEQETIISVFIYIFIIIKELIILIWLDIMNAIFNIRA